MSNFLKQTVIRDTVLRALSRMTSLPQTVWRDAGGSFRGAAGDVITVRVPAYTKADRRDLRAGTARTARGLFESRVNLSLTDNIYRRVSLTDEELTLDILDFSLQVINPVLQGMVLEIEDILVADAFKAATYAYTISAVDEADPYPAIVDARKNLNDAKVPAANRTLAIGSSLEAAIVKSDQFSRVDASGTSATLRQGTIGNIAGFSVVPSQVLHPDEAFAYHNTAYALSLQAPIVPPGAPNGFTASAGGFAIRLVNHLSDDLENLLEADIFAGATAVTDHGAVDVDGKFEPSEEPDLTGDTDQVFVRGVHLFTGSAAP